MRRKKDVFLNALITICAAFSALIAIGILAYVFIKGIRSINIAFLTTQSSTINGTVGIAGNIINTLYIIVITLLIAVPIGVGAAIYLNEYAKPGKLVSAIEFTTETLAGIPSIIFGLFGYIFFGEVLGFKMTLITGCFTLTIMVLPLITRNTQEALKTVPDSYRSGALGMGAPKWHMIRTILVPAALPGIITGIILSVGRIVGESAALLFTAGSSDLLPKISGLGFAEALKTLTATKITKQPGGTLTIQMYLRMSKGEYDAAFGIALVLLIIVLLINFLTHYLSNKFDVKNQA